MLVVNPILANDSYKLSHAGQTPGNTTLTYSHLTPRFVKYLKRKFPTMSEKVIVYGTQMTMQILTERWQEGFFNRPWDVIEAETLDILDPFLGFTAEHLARFKELHTLGYLPLRVKSLPEGSWVNKNIPVMTVVNTHPNFAWLTNFIESTILNTIYKPMTVATLTLELARLRDKYFDLTVSDQSGKAFALHDFSYRGQAGHESASATISAYLLYTKGTDTMSAIQYARHYYDAPKDIAGSIAAFEHSTATTGVQYYKDIVKQYTECSGDTDALAEKLGVSPRAAREGIQAVLTVISQMKESSRKDKDLAAGETFNLARVLIDVYPNGFFAYVSDSYDYQRLISVIVPALKDVILSRDGKFVIRPDSGDPVEVVCGTFKVDPTLVFETEEDCVADLKDTADEFFRENITSDGYCNETSYNVLIGGKFARVKVTAEIGRERGGYTDNNHYYVEEVKDPSVTYVKLTSENKGSIQVLSEIFGTTTNAKGYKELPPQIGLVYGDGMNYDRIEDIYAGLMEKGFAASSVVLSGGAYMLANLTRDDLGFAIKASQTIVDGVEVPVYKEPKTDMSKASAKGFFKVVKDESGEYRLLDNVTAAQEEEGELKEIWVNGKFTYRTTFEEIQSRLPL